MPEKSDVRTQKNINCKFLNYSNRHGAKKRPCTTKVLGGKVGGVGGALAAPSQF